MIYENPTVYLESCESLDEKIRRVDVIIAGLFTSAEKQAGKSNIEEYQIDDGQSKIRTSYTSMSAIFDSINDFEKLKQLYVNRRNGRAFSLKDRGSIC